MMRMWKKILISSLISIFIPLLLVSLLTTLREFSNRVGFIYLGLVMLSIIFFLILFMLDLKKYNILLPIIIILNIFYILLSLLVLKKPYWPLIGVLVNASALASHYTKWCYALMPLTSYPIVFNLFGINRDTIEVYIGIVLLTFALSIWLKYHKTKIYLYDNYGD